MLNEFQKAGFNMENINWVIYPNANELTEELLDKIIQKEPSSACDVIYFNTLAFEQLDCIIHIISGMQYDHVVHDGSVYLQTHTDTQKFINNIHNRYRNLKMNN